MMNYLGIREVCDVTLRAIRNIPECQSMTGKTIRRNEPVMYFERLKVSNITGSTTTVYASGGRGNARRLSWDGDKEITFHIEDALISPTSLAILMAAQMKQRQIVRKALDISDLDSGSSYISIDPVDFSITITLDPAAMTGFDPTTFTSLVTLQVDPLIYDSTTGTSAPASSTATPPATGLMLINPDDVQYNPGNITAVPPVYPTMTFSIQNTPTIEYRGIDLVSAFIVSEATNSKTVYKHEKEEVVCLTDNVLELKYTPYRSSDYPLFVFSQQRDGSLDLISSITTATGALAATGSVSVVGKNLNHPFFEYGNTYVVDYYRPIKGRTTSLVVTADATSDYYKLEGFTLMRRETDGQDVAIQVTFPKVKPRTSFEIPMSNTGDPSVFSFDFDVFPAESPEYKGCESNVMIIMDIIEDEEESCNCVNES